MERRHRPPSRSLTGAIASEASRLPTTAASPSLRPPLPAPPTTLPPLTTATVFPPPPRRSCRHPRLSAGLPPHRNTTTQEHLAPPTGKAGSGCETPRRIFYQQRAAGLNGQKCVPYSCRPRQLGTCTAVDHRRLEWPFNDSISSQGPCVELHRSCISGVYLCSNVQKKQSREQAPNQESGSASTGAGGGGPSTAARGPGCRPVSDRARP